MPRNRDDGHARLADILRCASRFCMYSHRGWSYSSSLPGSAPQSAYRRRRLKLPRLPTLSPLPFALLLVGGIVWYHFVFGGFSIRGAVVDSTTGQPILGARAWTSRASAISAADGEFTIERVKPPDAVAVDAPGYHAQTLRITNPFEPLVTRLEPI